MFSVDFPEAETTPANERKLPMIEVHTWPTPNGHKIHIMLEETGLEYEVRPVNIRIGEQFKPEFLRISPNNKIPAIGFPSGPLRSRRKADRSIRVGSDPDLPCRKDGQAPAARRSRKIRRAAMVDVPDGF